MDVTDIVDYNMETLNRNDLAHSFLQMSRDDPTNGFVFDASAVEGHVYAEAGDAGPEDDELTLRLRLGSHIAFHLRQQLESEKGYTCTVGIATSKLISKLVGNLNKPKGQTTLLPPLSGDEGRGSNIIRFMDGHEIGKVPGIGFKLAQKLRASVLQRQPEFDAGLVYGGTLEKVTVADVRNRPGIDPESLEKLLSGPGSPHGIGYKVWCLLHGVDESDVGYARAVPRQISIEDSYIRLDTMSEVLKELTGLARSLLTRMRVDLLGFDDDADEEPAETPLELDNQNDGIRLRSPAAQVKQKWLAHPRTLRLSTRPRQPLQADGTRVRSFKRISHSAPLPPFVFQLQESVDALAERLVRESLVPMFRRLHPEKAGWNLSLVNLAVTNMAETAGDSRTASGRDIGTMFRRQEDVLKDFRVVEEWTPLPKPEKESKESMTRPIPVLEDNGKSEETPDSVTVGYDDDSGGAVEWDDADADDEVLEGCPMCGMRMPEFAMVAHRRFHSFELH